MSGGPWTRHKIEQQYARLRVPGDALTKIASDIWCCDGPVASHFDSTAQGLVVYGLVLVNDSDLELHYRGGIFTLRAGSAYCINGHQDHAALPGQFAGRGLFAARVWDVPPGMSLATFAQRASTEAVKWLP